MTVEHLNPRGMHQNPGFSQGVVVSGNVKTVYVGGQNAVSGTGEIVGDGDFAKQCEQAIANVDTVLAAAGADLANVVKWNINVVKGQSLRTGFEVFGRAWGDRTGPPPAISVAIVAGLAHPEFLVEIEAIAVVSTD